MKEILKFKNLLFFSIIILLSSCGKTVDYDDEREYITLSNPSKGPRVLSYKGLPFNGELVEYFDDKKTQLKERKDYKEGKIDGQSEYYYENGQLESKGTYKDGERDGLWEYYEENGNIMDFRFYKDGKEVRQWEYFYENGQLEKSGTYKDGKEDGLFESYYENGQLLSKGTYKDGKKDGQWEHYDENGKLKEKESGMYKDGVKQDD